MADEFQTGICSGNWWNSSRTGFSGSSSPCSTALSEMGSFGWTEMADMKSRSCEESSASVSGSSVVFQDTQKAQTSDSIGSSVLIDSTLQMAGFGLSSPTIDWSQALLRSSGRTESSFHAMLQEDLTPRTNFRQEMGMESPKDFSGGGEDSSINAFKQLNQSFGLDPHRLSSGNNSGDSTNSFSISSSSYGCPSNLLQGLFDPDQQQQQQQQQQAAYDNRPMNYESPMTFRLNSNEFAATWPKFPPFLKTSPPKPQPSNQLHFSNNAPFWNASATTISDVRSGLFPSPQTQFVAPVFEEKPNCSNLTAKMKTEDVRESSSLMKKSSTEPAFKRPRIETPSPLPTFKVRKEKLGDRITALQQLVSPFGKTDTASVLFEAIEYIKFLHDQVRALCSPYMKNGAPMQQPQQQQQQLQQNSDKSKDGEGPKQDLRSRGLCLVPVSSTFAVTNETAADFWTPAFGGTFR
ncbi:transcription factor bHLH112-like [Magnolia sinica]|uniref:transcription factor bHLH112-like n=1 Tax=Magnolia sinica TaxID=86752 RepID=UPI002657D382|nr:transcription factor bHLH112-like [Magnolia sinica]